jgi:hypothetical protein
MAGSGVGKNGHRSVTVKVGKGGIPRGDTMILAFSGNPRGGGSVGAGGIITGRVLRGVSLPRAVRRERLRLNRYRDPGRLSRSAPGCSTTGHQIRGGCPAGHGQPPVRTKAENGVR